MATLILVRHGESEWNRVGRIQGQVNSPLTDFGVSQAMAIRDYLSEIFFNNEIKIYTSPLERAIKTAEIISQGISVTRRGIIIEERLNDFNLGEISGIIGWDRVAEVFPKQAKLRLQNPMLFHPLGGESGKEFDTRIRTLINEMMVDDKTKILVSHGIVNKFIRGIFKNLSGKEIIDLGESQNTIYRLENNEEIEIEVPPLKKVKN